MKISTFQNEPWKENFEGIDFCQIDQNSGNSGKLVPKIDHDITLKILEFVLNSTEKVKHGVLLSSMCIFSESNGTKS